MDTESNTEEDFNQIQKYMKEAEVSLIIFMIWYLIVTSAKQVCFQ